MRRCFECLIFSVHSWLGIKYQVMNTSKWITSAFSVLFVFRLCTQRVPWCKSKFMQRSWMFSQDHVTLQMISTSPLTVHNLICPMLCLVLMLASVQDIFCLLPLPCFIPHTKGYCRCKQSGPLHWKPRPIKDSAFKTWSRSKYSFAFFTCFCFVLFHLFIVQPWCNT